MVYVHSIWFCIAEWFTHIVPYIPIELHFQVIWSCQISMDAAVQLLDLRKVKAVRFGNTADIWHTVCEQVVALSSYIRFSGLALGYVCQRPRS